MAGRLAGLVFAEVESGGKASKGLQIFLWSIKGEKPTSNPTPKCSIVGIRKLYKPPALRIVAPELTDRGQWVYVPHRDVKA